MSKFTKLRGWLKARRSRQPHTQAAPTDFDLYEAARGDLWAKSADNPRLARLLTEIERGRERAARMSCEEALRTRPSRYQR